MSCAGTLPPKLTPLFLLVVAVAWIFLYGHHFSEIIRSGVYVPLGDILDNLKHLETPTFSEIFRTHNEHRIVTTKLQMILFYHLNGLDFQSLLIFNFVLYGIIVLIIPFLMLRWVSIEAALIALLFSTVQLSPQGSEIHAQVFNGLWHFSTFFALLGAAFLTRNSIRSTLLAALLFIASIYSGGVGLGYVAGILVAYTWYTAIRLLEVRQTDHLKSWILLTLICAAAILFWNSSSSVPGMEQTLPWSKSFWDFYLNMVSYGIGITTTEIYPGLVFLVLAVLPITIIMVTKRSTISSHELFLVSISLGVLVSIGLISVGRANGGVQMAKSLRYYETVSLLVPVTAMLWNFTLKCYRGMFLAFMAVVVAYFSYPSWRYDTTYNMYRQLNAQVTGCYNEILIRKAPPQCPYGYPVLDWSNFIQTIKSLELHFVKTLK